MAFAVQTIAEQPDQVDPATILAIRGAAVDVGM